MRSGLAGGMRAAMLALALWGLAPAAQAQPVEAPPPGDSGSDIDVQAMHSDFDRLARSFSKKKRSELINLKTYTDEEWAALEAAVAANNAACLERDAEACLDAGRAYETGDGVWIVPDIAYILYGEACDLGLGEGCRAFFDLAQSGWGYPPGGVAAADGMLRRACATGDETSCIRLTEGLTDNTAEDRVRSDAPLEAACEAGRVDACASVGSIWSESADPALAARGAALLEDSCAAGFSAACIRRAGDLERRAGHDPAQTSRLRDRACEAGDAAACSTQGRLAWTGPDPAVNRARAMDYYAKACAIDAERCDLVRALAAVPALEAGCAAEDAGACADLGEAMLAYDWPEDDHDRARVLLETACQARVYRACASAAETLLSTAPDAEARAAELRETGCAGQDPASCFALAVMLETRPDGSGTGRAVALYRQLCDADYPRACEAEQQFAGLVDGARILPAGENYTAPLPTDAPTDLHQASDIREVCMTGSETFRGKTYEHFACDRGEKGINSERARPGQAPWQALLWRPATMFGKKLVPAERVLCGGSLIAPGWIVTAAHCLDDDGIRLANPAARAGYRIRLGVYNPAMDEGVSFPILKVIPHPQFDPANNYVFDIALVQYDTAAATRSRAGARGAPANPIRTIALDPQAVGKRRIVAGMPVYAFGWGWTAAEKSTATDYLQIIKMGLSTEQACAEVTRFAAGIASSALCAKGRHEQQTCFGDSGGPLVFYGDPDAKPVLIGVVSAGVKCGQGRTKRASQYTRIARVRDWIARNVPGLR